MKTVTFKFTYDLDSAGFSAETDSAEIADGTAFFKYLNACAAAFGFTAKQDEADESVFKIYDGDSPTGEAYKVV